jgi:hypothetical protein
MEYDSFLLKENANERSITHKLAEYLQQEFKDLDVDCEYNRMWNDLKIDKKIIQLEEDMASVYDTDAKTVFPDIIVHKRENKDNLLVVEVKKSNNTSNKLMDKVKLETFTYSDHFNYLFGVNLVLYVQNVFGKPSHLQWYQNGEVFHEEFY